ncbi:MAG TPA: hypothetical protein VIQ53_00995 [Inquilinus sp.]
MNAVLSQTTGPAQGPQQTPAAAQPARKQMTPAEFLMALGTLRANMGEQEFAELIGRHEGLVYRYLGPFGFQGCWSKSSDYIKDFDAAMAKAGYAIPAFQMSARLRDVGTYTGPPQTSMSAVEPGQRFSRYSVYQEFQMKMDNLQGAGPGIIPAAALLITSGQEAADKALEQSQAVGGLATAMGGTYQAKSAMPYNQEVNNRDRITPATTVRADRVAPAPTPGPAAPAVNTQTTAPPAATTNQTVTPPAAAKTTAPPPAATTSTPPSKANATAPAATTNAPSTTSNVQNQTPTGPSFSDVGDAARRSPGSRITDADPTRRRNQYSDFEKPSSRETATVNAEVQRLSGAMGIPMPANRVLVAPWVGRPRNAAGDTMSSGTSEGWQRSTGRFWSAFEAQYPSDYSLIGPQHRVTQALAQRWNWPASTVGERLIHHHINNGAYVILVPENMHGGDVHRTPTVMGTP